MKVYCRVGGLEKRCNYCKEHDSVYCRVGGLETEVAAMRVHESVYCRVGGLEIIMTFHDTF